MNSGEGKKIKHCPNCGDTNIKQKGNEVLCLSCECIFEISNKGEARVKKIGALDEIHERLDKIEQTVYKSDELDESDEVADEDEDIW